MDPELARLIRLIQEAQRGLEGRISGPRVGGDPMGGGGPLQVGAWEAKEYGFLQADLETILAGKVPGEGGVRPQSAVAREWVRQGGTAAPAPVTTPVPTATPVAVPPATGTGTFGADDVLNPPAAPKTGAPAEAGDPLKGRPVEGTDMLAFDIPVRDPYTGLVATETRFVPKSKTPGVASIVLASEIPALKGGVGFENAVVSYDAAGGVQIIQGKVSEPPKPDKPIFVEGPGGVTWADTGYAPVEGGDTPAYIVVPSRAGRTVETTPGKGGATEGTAAVPGPGFEILAIGDMAVGQSQTDIYGNQWFKDSDEKLYRVDRKTGRLLKPGGTGGGGVRALTAAEVAGLKAGQSRPVLDPSGKPIPGMLLVSDGTGVQFLTQKTGSALPSTLLRLAATDLDSLGEAIATVTNAGRTGEITWEAAGTAVDLLKEIYSEGQRLREVESTRAFNAGESALQRASYERTAAEQNLSSERNSARQQAASFASTEASLLSNLVPYGVGKGVQYVAGHGPGGAAEGMARITGQTYRPEEHKVQRQTVDFVEIAQRAKQLAGAS